MLQVSWVGLVIAFALIDVGMFFGFIYMLKETVKAREWGFTICSVCALLLLIFGTIFAIATFPGWRI